MLVARPIREGDHEADAALTVEEFNDSFRSAECSVLRLENRRLVDLVDERDELRAFLAGDLPEVYPWEQTEWTEMVARHAAAGRAFRRVRVVEYPLDRPQPLHDLHRVLERHRR